MTDTAMNPCAAPNTGTLTSLAQLFVQPVHGVQVKAIEIPLFQRDYAQGRHSEQARQVRTRFIADLCAALDSGQELHLDFVFGDVVQGTLYPLDGQQRLTTLFLLHCYLAWQVAGVQGAAQPWHAFHYATRPGARAFCQFLTQCQPDMATPGDLSAWLCDQAAYLPTWKHDPTIQGMLVVLDALHQHYRSCSPDQLHSAWQRLTDPQNPAIRFLLLPVAAQKLDNSLYVKMNSRGRPLTAFENFKADFEALLHKNTAIDRAAVDAFSRKIDDDWADLFWQYRGDNDLIDEECMRYLRFLFEVLAWRRGLPVQTGDSDWKALHTLAQSLFTDTAPDAKTDFDWLVQALDVWLEEGAEGVRRPKAIAALFSQLFTRNAQATAVPLRIFNFRDFGDAPVGVDMFHACCMLYGTRPWSLAHTVMLYGVLQGLMQGTPLPDLHPRLRLLRNLIEASRSEIRADDTRNNMPALLHEVAIIMAGGPLTDVKTFNQVQMRNEQAKQALVAAHPTLLDTVHQLEDHELLRGGLTVFDLDPAQDPATFSHRAAQFPLLFDGPYPQASAALLAKGHSGRQRRRSAGYRLAFLGAPKRRQTGLWEDHWRIRYNEPIHPSSTALMGLLDDMAAGHTPQAVIDAFVHDPATVKDWRYYLVKYDAMRSEHLNCAGSYVIAPEPGYALCIPLSDSCDNRSNHHDAYLLALAQVAALAPQHIANPSWPRCFPGSEANERHLALQRSGLKIRCIDQGWALSKLPTDPAQRSALDIIAQRHNLQGELCAVPQAQGIDTEDRIGIGAALLRDLVAAGF